MQLEVGMKLYRQNSIMVTPRISRTTITRVTKTQAIVEKEGRVVLRFPREEIGGTFQPIGHSWCEKFTYYAETSEWKEKYKRSSLEHSIRCTEFEKLSTAHLERILAAIEKEDA